MAAHRYWRLYITSANGSTVSTLTELEMFDTAGGVNQCTGGTSFSSSDYDANWLHTKAFDGIKTGNQGWASSTSQTWPTWIGYDFGEGNEKDIIQFNIISQQNNPGHINESPKNFKLQFSDDNIWWYDAGAQFTNVSDWGANETRTFNIVPLAIANKSLHSAAFPLVEISASNTITARSIVAGESEISGRISIAGVPTEDILVRLHHSDSGILVKSTKTNTIGDYKFENVDRYSLFDVVAEDPLKEWEKVVSSRRTPYTSSRIGKCNMYGGERLQFGITKAAPFRYFKLNITSSGDANFINLGAIRLTGEGYQNLCTTYGGTWSQSSAYNSSFESNRAFLETGMWHSAAQSAPFWAQWDFGSGNAHGVDELGVTYTNCCNRYPVNFTFEGSNDGSTWTTLKTVSGETSWTVDVMKIYAL